LTNALKKYIIVNVTIKLGWCGHIHVKHKTTQCLHSMT